MTLYGEESLRELPKMMGSEDFAYFMEKVPGVFGFLGSYDEKSGCIYSNHNDRYDVVEDALKRGAAMHAGKTAGAPALHTAAYSFCP